VCGKSSGTFALRSLEGVIWLSFGNPGHHFAFKLKFSLNGYLAFSSKVLEVFTWLTLSSIDLATCPNEAPAEGQNSKSEQTKHTRFGDWLVGELNRVEIQILIHLMWSVCEDREPQLRSLALPRMDVCTE
jgi:hypothetical protein